MSNYKIVDLRSPRKVSVCECGHSRNVHTHWGEGEPDNCSGSNNKGCSCRKFWDNVNRVNYDDAGYI